jgi:hypothetical protein
MKKLLLLSSILLLTGCSSIGKGNVQGDAKDFNWSLDGNQSAEVEFFESGQIKRAKIDNKAEPLIKLGNIAPKFEE